VYGADPAAQSTAPAARNAFIGLGGKVVDSESLTEDAASYQTEALKVASANPQVIFTEADPQTNATFFKDLLALGHLVPIVGDNATGDPQWTGAVGAAIGAANLQKDFHFLTFGTPPGNPTTPAKLYNKWVSKVPHFQSFYLNQPALMALWDQVQEMALAMLEAHSVSPKAYIAYIAKVGMPRRGAVVVHDYAEGKAALARGKQITYVGASGPAIYNKYHNGAGLFDVYGSDLTTISATIPGATVTRILAKYGG
jgi:hypothetical protein